jgi:hypothetical protein
LESDNRKKEFVLLTGAGARRYANLIQTLSWKDRSARRIAPAEDGVLEQVLLRIIPLIGADRVIERHLQTD